MFAKDESMINVEIISQPYRLTQKKKKKNSVKYTGCELLNRTKIISLDN